MGAVITILLIVAALIFLCIAPGWIVYQKAGKPGWAYIVPIYNMIVLMEIVKKPLWFFLLLCIPIVNIYAVIVVYNRLAKSFDKGIGYTIGLILFPFIFMPLLAFGSAQYQPLPEE